MTFQSRAIYPNVSGAQQDFGVTQPYLDKSHIHVYTRDPATGIPIEVLPSGFSWSSANLIHLLSAPTVGLTVEIWRQTPRDVLLSRINPASVIIGNAVNVLATQLLYISQEVADSEVDITQRALQVPINEIAPPLSSFLARAGKVLGATATGVIAWLNPVDLLASIKGDPGGNAMAIGSFAALSGIDVPGGTNRVRTEDGTDYIYDAAVDSAFVTAHPRAAAISHNGRGFRLDLRQQLTVLMFQAVADDDGTSGTDNAPAFAAAFDYLQLYALNGAINGNIYRGAPSLHIPAGHYYTSQPLAPLFTGEIYGDGGLGWGAPTHIRFPAGVDGLQIQAYNTSGATTFDSTTHYAGDQLHVRDIYFTGGYAGTEGEFHGCRAKRAFDLSRCTFDNFQGDALYSHVTFNSGVGSTEGNTNVARVTNCVFTNCRSGISSLNADANAWSVILSSFISNRRWGVEERSFLGNHYYGNHFDANGRGANNTGAAGKPTSYVVKNGHIYFAVDGQETWCALNSPSGTTADNQGWGYFNEVSLIGGADIPTWVSGINVRSGGHVLTSGLSNVSSVVACHMEINAVSQLDQGAFLSHCVMSLTVGVTSGTLNRARTNSLSAGSTGLTFGGNVNVNGDFRPKSPNNLFGPSDGDAALDGTTVFGTRNTSHTVEFRAYDAAGGSSISYAGVTYNVAVGAIHDASVGNGHRWQVAGAEIARAEAGGFKLTTGNAYYINGLQVVGARLVKPGSPTLTDVVNALVTHGLWA